MKKKKRLPGNLPIVLLSFILIGCTGANPTTGNTTELESSHGPNTGSSQQIENEVQGVRDSLAIADRIVTYSDGYLGCWSGMHGGLLKITRDKVYDLGSKESASIKNVSMPRDSILQGMETGEIYVLETSGEFRKSFLSSIIKLSSNSDGTVGIVSYDSPDHYSKDEFTGIGLFGKVNCAEFSERSHSTHIE